MIEPSAFAADLAMQADAEAVIPIKNVFTETARITGAKIYKPIGIEDYEQMIEVNLEKQQHGAIKTVIKF